MHYSDVLYKWALKWQPSQCTKHSAVSTNPITLIKQNWLVIIGKFKIISFILMMKCIYRNLLSDVMVWKIIFAHKKSIT